MKHKLLTTLIVLFASLGIAVAADYHYGFSLSCGKTVYRSFDTPLTDAELLMWTDIFEVSFCGRTLDETPSL
jgi:hypothetical protein